MRNSYNIIIMLILNLESIDLVVALAKFHTFHLTF